MKNFLNVLSVIGLLAWCICFALGFNYQQGGAMVISILLCAFLAAFMGMLLFLMKRWSRPKSSDHKANAKQREMYCLGIYIFTIILSASSFAHFVTVQSTVKNEIRPLAQQRIAELERVFGDENTTGSYLNYIQETVIPPYEKFLEDKYNGDEKTIKLSLSRLRDELTNEGEFTTLQEDVNDFLGYCRYSVENWVPWTITSYLSELDNNTEKWETEVTKMSTNHEWTSSEPFIIKPTASDKLMGEISNPSVSIFSSLTILLIIIVQIISLLSYIANRDWSHHKPIKPTGDFFVWNGDVKPQGKNKKLLNTNKKEI